MAYVVLSPVEGDTDLLATLELWLEKRKWRFERDDTTITFVVAGGPEQYTMGYDWDEEDDMLMYFCRFEFVVSSACHDEIDRLTHLLNKELTIGHFEHHPDRDSILYRSSLVLPGGEVSDQQADALLQLGLDACDTHQAAYRLVAAGETAVTAFANNTRMGQAAGHA